MFRRLPAAPRPSPVRDGDLSMPSVLPRRPLLQFQFAAIPDCIHCPIPPKPTSCGLPGTLSVILSVAVRAPVAFGVKVTTTEQLAPGASVAGDNGQVVVCAKSLASAPLIVGFLTVIGVPLGLPIVIDSGLLFVPTFSVPKFSALGKDSDDRKIEHDGHCS